MRTTQGTTQRASQRRAAASAGSRNAYIQGNTVRKLNPAQHVEESPLKKVSHSTRKNRDKAHYMNMGYVLFLTMALLAAGFILTGYLGLQSDITNSIKHISRLESQLNDLRLANDEEYSRITSSIDLEEVKRVAIQELGMRYAEAGQIVEFIGGGSDYVRQVAEIPE